MINAQAISLGEFEALCANAEILRGKKRPRVIRHDTNLISKIWYKKKKLSSDWIYPYYLRFYRNSKKLLSHGIVAPKVRAVIKVKKTYIRMVTYEEIHGLTVRDILQHNKGDLSIPKLAQFIGRLHDKGIFFTSLHMGNIIKLESGDFGLIDVSNTHFYYFPLGLRTRARNLCNLASYTEDIDLIQRDMNTNIIEEYLKHMDRPSKFKSRFSELVKEKLSARHLKKESLKTAPKK
jgi:tRNA A-37 threonylcarbamoyl transferase component Bud32